MIMKLSIIYPLQIQTTSPEKFRVRPRCGVIPQNESTEVNIWLKSDQILSSDGKDKFLVMAACSPEAECSSQAVADMWRAKSSTDPDVETFRLVCRMDEKSECAKNAKSDSSSNVCSYIFFIFVGVFFIPCISFYICISLFWFISGI